MKISVCTPTFNESENIERLILLIKIELEKSWSLSPGEMHYIEKKDNKLVYALKMKYFDIQGYFPKQGDDIPAVAIKHVAAQLSLLNQSSSQTHI